MSSMKSSAKADAEAAIDRSTAGAMDIMMKLKGDALTAVYSDFKAISDAEGRGLTLTEFVSSVLRHIAEQTHLSTPLEADSPDLVALTRDLVDVFQQIDVNGDQSLEWEEFAAFAIESGNASAGIGRNTGFIAVHDHAFTDLVTKTMITHAEYLYEVDAIVALEQGAKEVRLYSSTMLLVRTIDSSTAVRSRTADERVLPVTCALCLPKAEEPTLAVLLSNGVIGLWRLDNEETCPFAGILPRTALGYTPACLAWEGGRKRLMVGCTNGSVWTYNAGTKSAASQLEAHKDVIISMASSPRNELFFTSDLGGKVLVWSSDSNTVKSALVGQDEYGAVTRLTMVEALDVLFGIAGGSTILGWDVGASRPAMRIGQGVHHAKIVDIAHVKTTPTRLASIDEDRQVVIWEVTAAFMGAAPVVTQFNAEAVGSFRPTFILLTCPPTVHANNRCALKPAPLKPSEKLRGASEALMAVIAEKTAEAAAAKEHANRDSAARASVGNRAGQGGNGGAKHSPRKGTRGESNEDAEERASRLRAAENLRVRAKQVEAHNAAHKLGIAGDVIVCGARIVRYVSQPTSRLDCPVAALYNPVFLRFITAVGRDVFTWKAGTGRAGDVFLGCSHADITCFTFDDRRRKLFVGTTAGRVEALNLANGAFMKGGRLHAGAVADMVYVDADRLLVACGWDGSLVVYDDEPGDALDPLRSVTYAHEGDITALAVSPELAFILTGDKMGNVRAWDYQDLKQIATLAGHKSIVTAAATFGAMPLAVTADGDGQIILWSTRGYSPPVGTAGHRFTPWSRLYSFTNMTILKEVYDPVAEQSAAARQARALRNTARGAAMGMRSPVVPVTPIPIPATGPLGHSLTKHATQLVEKAKEQPQESQVDTQSTARSTTGNPSMAGSLSLAAVQEALAKGGGATLTHAHRGGTGRGQLAETEEGRTAVTGLAPGTASASSTAKPSYRSMEQRKADRLSARAAAWPTAPNGEIMVAGMAESAFRAMLDSKVKLTAMIEQIMDDIAASKEVGEGRPRRKRAYKLSVDAVANLAEEAARAIKARLRVREKRTDTGITTMKLLIPQHAEPVGVTEKDGSESSTRFHRPVILCIGDDAGRLSVLDILPIIRRLGVVPTPTKIGPRSLQSFNAHRRTHRDEAGPVITDEGYFYSADVASGPGDLSSLAKVDIDLILALEKGRGAKGKKTAVGLGKEAEAKIGKPARRASLLKAVGADSIARVLEMDKEPGPTTTHTPLPQVKLASGGFKELPGPETGRAEGAVLAPDGISFGHRRGSTGGGGPGAEWGAGMYGQAGAIGLSADALMAKLYDDIDRIQKANGQKVFEEVKLRAPNLAERRAIIAKDEFQADPDAVRPLIPLEGASGVGIVAAMNRRGSVEARRVMRRASLEANVANAVSRETVQQLTSKPNVRTLVGVQALNRPDNGGWNTMDEDEALLSRELSHQPGDIRELHVIPAAHAGSLVSMCLVEAEHVAKAPAATAHGFLLQPTEELPAEVAQEREEAGEPRHTVPALAGYYITTTGSDGKVLVWDLVQGRVAGQLGQTREDEERLAHGQGALFSWSFPGPGPEQEGKARDEAGKLLEIVDAEASGSILHTQGSMSEWDSVSRPGSASKVEGEADDGGEEECGDAADSADLPPSASSHLQQVSERASTLTHARPGRTLEQEQELIEEDCADSVEKVMRQTRLVEVLPRKECKAAVKKLGIPSRPGGFFVASTVLRDLMHPPGLAGAKSIAASLSSSSGDGAGAHGGGRGGSGLKGEEEDSLEVMLPAKKLLHFDPAVLKETGGWGEGHATKKAEGGSGGKTEHGQISLRDLQGLSSPSYTTILASSSPAAYAAEAFGPAAAVVLGLTGYDTRSDAALKAMEKGAVKLASVAPLIAQAMNSAVKAHAWSTFEEEEKSSPGSRSRSPTASVAGRGPGSTSAWSPTAAGGGGDAARMHELHALPTAEGLTQHQPGAIGHTLGIGMGDSMPSVFHSMYTADGAGHSQAQAQAGIEGFSGQDGQGQEPDRVLRLMAHELASSARMCGVKQAPMDAGELTDKIIRLAAGESVARLGRAKPLDAVTAAALVHAMGGMQIQPAPNAMKIVGMYGHLEAERLRHKVGTVKAKRLLSEQQEQQGQGGADSGSMPGTGSSIFPSLLSPSQAHAHAADGKEEAPTDGGVPAGRPPLLPQLASPTNSMRSPIRVVAAPTLNMSSPSVKPTISHPSPSMHGRPPASSTSASVGRGQGHGHGRGAGVDRVSKMNALLSALDAPRSHGHSPSAGDAPPVPLHTRLEAVQAVLTSPLRPGMVRGIGGSGAGTGGSKREGRVGGTIGLGSEEEPDMGLGSTARSGSPDASASPRTMPSYFGPYSTLAVLRARRVFQAADEDGSGDVSLDELLAQPEWRRMYKPEQLAHLFEAMDSDASGRVTAAELFAVMFPKVDAATRRQMLFWTDPRRMAKLAKPPTPALKTLSARARAEADTILDALDRDRDGLISLGEVMEAMRANAQGGKKEKKKQGAGLGFGMTLPGERKGGLVGLPERSTSPDKPTPVAPSQGSGEGGGGGRGGVDDELAASVGTWNRADVEAVFKQYALDTADGLVIDRAGWHKLWAEVTAGSKEYQLL